MFWTFTTNSTVLSFQLDHEFDSLFILLFIEFTARLDLLNQLLTSIVEGDYCTWKESCPNHMLLYESFYLTFHLYNLLLNLFAWSSIKIFDQLNLDHTRSTGFHLIERRSNFFLICLKRIILFELVLFIRKSIICYSYTLTLIAFQVFFLLIINVLQDFLKSSDLSWPTDQIFFLFKITKLTVESDWAILMDYFNYPSSDHLPVFRTDFILIFVSFFAIISSFLFPLLLFLLLLVLLLHRRYNQ